MIYASKFRAQEIATQRNDEKPNDGFWREPQLTANGWTIGLRSPYSQRDVMERG